ncbi:DUF4179 domain-containing protein [Niallia sp. NCCP-28]|uniref:DUF4179 domain-containing protein n=1 Tax=Niallia sp. NCCP-28 TaxID=2934712 RepID=UPI00207ED69B|nr:DUF4179 domain-containing protein [Niallia sp. NCCP-28]GKU83773.1 hypothetical protein NCCP28_31690 [Niallia sp. NCCP-28]
MFNKEEEILLEEKKKLDELTIPFDKLDREISLGLERGKKEKARSKHKRIMTYTAAAILFITIFLGAIRISPAFANYAANIPGMEKIIELVQEDKGQLAAVENKYYEKINIFEKRNGITLKIDGAIRDEEGLIVFYTVDAKGADLKDINLKFPDKKELASRSSYEGFPVEEGKKKFSSTLEYFFDEPFNEKDFYVEASFIKDNQKVEISIPFSLTKNIQKNKVLPVNKKIMVEEQEINIVDITISPLRIAVHVKQNPKNTKKILEYTDLRLIDKNGEAWTMIPNGITASGMDSDEQLIYLQSNYFQEPEELYLVLNKLQAIDKEDEMLKISWKQKKILKQPKGDLLTLKYIRKKEIALQLHVEKTFHYGLFSSGTASDGKELDISSMWTEGSGDLMGIEFNEPINTYKDPLSLPLSSFPSWIEGDVKLRVK